MDFQLMVLLFRKYRSCATALNLGHPVAIENILQICAAQIELHPASRIPVTFL